MTKRMLTVAVAVALVAAMAIPAVAVAVPANTTDVTGSIAEATIEITAPTPIAFGMLEWGENTEQSTTGLLVTVTANSRNPDGTGGVYWDVNAKDETNGGYMQQTDTTALQNKLQIGEDGLSWTAADVGITYDGYGAVTGGEFDFYAEQTIDSDAEEVGDYSITITFTAEINV
jgi:hypothetical protein